METLKYKGFIGSIEVNLEDNTLYGKLLGLNKGSLVTYEGNTVTELKEDFIAAVDDYIIHCKENGLPLQKSYSGSFNIRIPAEMHARLAMSAQSAGLSLNSYVRKLLSKS